MRNNKGDALGLTREQLELMSVHQLIATCLRLQEKIEVRNLIIGQ